MAKASPIVDVRRLDLHLMSGKQSLHILREIDLEIAPGEVVATVGPSGSGKTSLLMILAGLERASSGKVLVAGEDISALNEDQLAVFRRRNLGILFQSFHLIPSMTALENVTLALEIAETGQSLRQIREAAAAALERVDLSDRLGHLPSRLSGGEQQRVALARAIVTGPRLLLADEPTGNLDQESGEQVIALMFALARERGSTVFLITHDPALAARADRRLQMNYGRLSEGAVVPA